MFPDMWSRSITAFALCVTCVSGTLAALPAPPGAASAASTQTALMGALALAPAAVATWKRDHDHASAHKAARHPSDRKKSSKKGVKSRPHPFRITVFAGS